MHHHDLTLVGRADHIDALKAALVTAGAQPLEDRDRVQLEWATASPAPVEDIAASHPDVELRMRRIHPDVDEVQEVVVAGGRVTVDRKRRVFRDRTGEVSCAWGLCMDEDGDRLHRADLKSAADSVLATAHPDGPATFQTGLFDALRLSEQAGKLMLAVGDPYDASAPDDIALAGLRVLASTALTISCADTSNITNDVPASRQWCMREAVVHAGAEELWSTPGNASWPEWLGYVLTNLSSAIEACQACGWMPVTDSTDGDDDERFLSPDRDREAATGALVSTCLQALVLFGTSEGDGGNTERAPEDSNF